MIRLNASLALLSCLCACSTRKDPALQPGTDPLGYEIEVSIEEALDEARRAVDEHGVSDRAMGRIQESLRRLAATRGLKEHAKLGEVHGGGVGVPTPRKWSYA